MTSSLLHMDCLCCDGDGAKLDQVCSFAAAKAVDYQVIICAEGVEKDHQKDKSRTSPGVKGGGASRLFPQTLPHANPLLS